MRYIEAERKEQASKRLLSKNQQRSQKDGSKKSAPVERRRPRFKVGERLCRYAAKQRSGLGLVERCGEGGC